MHTDISLQTPALSEKKRFTALRMIWLEITLVCNEHCAHCYNASGKEHAKDPVLPKEKWFSLLEEARRLGASEVQFIGGEPTLVPWLKEGLIKARELGYEKVELYTNGTKLDKDLLHVIVTHDIHVAVSVYSYEKETHDKITVLPGSHERTWRNIHILKDAGVSLRLAVVSMPHNQHVSQETVRILREQGFSNVGIDNVRAFGRALALTKRPPNLNELCGQCWNGTLCITPQGEVSPCIMSRNMKIGDVTLQSLEEILESRESLKAKKAIFDIVWKPRNVSSFVDVSFFTHSEESFKMSQSLATSSVAPSFLSDSVLFVMPDPDGNDLPGKACLPETNCAPRYAPGPEQLFVSACLPNSPYPPAPCFPSSTPSNPCGPQTCMPGSGPCFPI